jgi:hypothetical protein
LTASAIPGGSHYAEISVSDGITTVSQSWTIEVSAANQAPVFTSVPDEVDTVDVDVPYVYAITYNDPDGDNVQLSGTRVPSWMVLINEGAGVARLLGNPRDEQKGNHDVTLTISDGQASVSQSFTISVGVEVVIPPDTTDTTGSIVNIPDEIEPEADLTEDEEVEKVEESVLMYPNPAHTVLTIESVKRDMTVVMYDQSGGLVKTVKMEEGTSTLDVSDVEPGLYLIQVGNSGRLYRVIID